VAEVEVVVTAAGVKTVVKKVASIDWDETLHPRDKNGKFIKKGSLVALKNGQIAKVTGVTKGVGGKPKLQVEVIGANKVSFPQAASVTAQYQPGDKVKLGVNTGTVTGVLPLKDKTMITVNLSNGLKVTVGNDQLEHIDPHPPHPASPAADTGAVIGKDQNGEPLHLGDPVVGDDGLDVTIGKVTGVDKSGNVLINGGPFEPQTVTKKAVDPALASLIGVDSNGENLHVGDTVKTSTGETGQITGKDPSTNALIVNGHPYWPKGLTKIEPSAAPDQPPELMDVIKQHTPSPAKLNANGTYAELPKIGDRVQSSSGLSHGVVTAVDHDKGTVAVKWDPKQLNDGTTTKSEVVFIDPVEVLKPEEAAPDGAPDLTTPAKGVATIPPVGTPVKVNYNPGGDPGGADAKVVTGKITQIEPDDGMGYVETEDGGQLGWIAKADLEPIGSVANAPVTAPIPIKDKHDAPIGAGDTLKGDNGTTWKVISIKDGVATLISPEGNGAPQDMPASVVSDQMIKTGGTPLTMHGEPIAVGDTVHSAISGANWEVTDIYPDGTVDLKSPSGKTINVAPANMAHLVKGEGSGPPPLDSHKSYNGYDGQTVYEGDTVYDKKGNAYHVDAIDPGAGTATATGTEGPGKGLTKTLPLAKFQAVTAKSKNATPVELKHGAEISGVTDSLGHPLHVGDTVQKDDYSTGTITGPSGDSDYYVMVDGKRIESSTLKRLDGPDPAANPVWHDDVTANDVTGQPIANGDTVYIPTIDRKATVVGNLPPDYAGETARLIVQDPDDKSNHVVPAGGAEKVTDPSLLYGQKAEDSLPKVKLSGSQEEALDDYTSSGYATVNTELRNYKGDLHSVKQDDGSAVSDQIKRLDSAIKKSASKQPIMVYRGMHHPHPERIKVGTTFRDWGFISTTTDRSVADGFGPNVLMQLPLPAGQHALSIDNNGGGAQGGAEDEILLPRGQAFYTTNVIKTNGRIVIQAKPVDKPTGPVLASANMPVTQPAIEPQEKSAMERYAERLIWEPEDVEIISAPEEPDHEQAVTAAGSGRFSGDPAHFFGGDKKFPKGPHLGTWEELKKANPGVRETVGHVKPDEVLLASQDHHDRQITATYRAGGDGPHADTPPKVLHHAKTGRKHVVNGHHRILADRIHGRISPVIYLGGVLPGDSGTAGDSPPAAAAVTGEEFGIKKDIKHAWAEAAHPRDKNGRFIPKGSHVTLGDGSTGQVVGAKVLPGKGKGKDGKPNPGVTMLTVKRDNGTTAVVQANTTVKDPAPIKGVPSTKTRIIHSNPKVPAADLMKSIKDNGGFTYDPKTGGLMVPGKDTGIAVAVPGTEQIVGTGTVSRHQFAKGVQKVLQAHRAQIAQGAKLGGWYSEDRNAYMVELTDVLPGDNRDAAIAEGQKRNQEGIFDIGKGEFIPTGGTGDAHPAEDAALAPPGAPDAPDAHVPKHAAPDVAPKHAAPDEPPEWTSQDPATWTPRQKEAHDTAGKVIAKYAAIEPTVTEQLMDATGGLPSAQLANLDFKLKTQNSLARKLHDKTLDPEKGTIQSYSAGIGDALRYTQTSDEAHLAANAQATLAALQQKGWTVKEVGNTWTPGAEYKGINTNLTTPDGQHTFELQFHTPQSLAVKENNHKLYDVSRLPETPKPEKERLKAQMVANSAEIAEPAGINTVQMPTTTTPANVDPLGPPTAGGTNTPLIPPGTKLDPGGLIDIAKAQPTPSASPHGVDFRNMTPSQKIAAVATMYGIGSKQYERAVKKWGKKGAGATVG
jgi:hypothetical protein